jgi:hypothetical protein
MKMISVAIANLITAACLTAIGASNVATHPKLCCWLGGACFSTALTVGLIAAR